MAIFNKKRVLVLGGNGMLGGAILRKFYNRDEIELATSIRGEKLAWNADVVCFPEENFSINNNFEIIKEFKPNYVLNCIGDVKKYNSEISNRNQIYVNSLLPHLLAQLADKYKFHLLHFSTDCVFDGQTGGYNDFSKKSPIDIYGQSKSLGEVNIKGATTLRTSIVGPEFDVKKNGLFEWFKSQNNIVEGYVNAQYSGLTTNELGNILLKLILNDKIPEGILTVSGPKINKLKLLNLFKEYLQKEIEIKPNYKIKIDRTLDDSRFRKMYPNLLKKSWQEMVSKIECFNEFF